MLRELREAAGLTQEELAAQADLTAKAVSALERGERKRPYPHTVRALADALELSGDKRSALLAVVPNRRAEAPTAAQEQSKLSVPHTSLPSVLSRTAPASRRGRSNVRSSIGAPGAARTAAEIVAPITVARLKTSPVTNAAVGTN